MTDRKDLVERMQHGEQAAWDKRSELPDHVPDHGRTGHPAKWCPRCAIEHPEIATPAPVAGEAVPQVSDSLIAIRNLADLIANRYPRAGKQAQEAARCIIVEVDSIRVAALSRPTEPTPAGVTREQADEAATVMRGTALTLARYVSDEKMRDVLVAELNDAANDLLATPLSREATEPSEDTKRLDWLERAVVENGDDVVFTDEAQSGVGLAIGLVTELQHQKGDNVFALSVRAAIDAALSSQTPTTQERK